jgi:UDP-GlcNAc:undecaprenyl-phosphate/decaprenyl-phosphate GlcNAc-1-phosphate transferase
VLLVLIPVSLLIIWASIAAGRKIGLVDSPDARKQHLGDVPLTGGIAIFITILACTLLLGIPPYTAEMLIIACLVFIIGVYDDYSHLNPIIRLVIQYMSGVLLATYGGIAIHQVGSLLAMGQIPLLLLSVPLTALSVAGLSNAYNMIDGIDGLAASTITLPLLVLFGLALQAGHPMANSILLILTPVLIFLCFNLGPNTRLIPKVFLGDGGSITLGFLVTASLVYFSQGDSALIQPVTALWLVTVPLMDMLATMLRRLKHGRKLMEADRSHLHHTLIDMGLGTRKTLALLVAYASLCALAGLALERVAESVSLLSYTLLFAGHCIFVIKSARTGRSTDNTGG